LPEVENFLPKALDAKNSLMKINLNNNCSFRKTKHFNKNNSPQNESDYLNINEDEDTKQKQRKQSITKLNKLGITINDLEDIESKESVSSDTASNQSPLLKKKNNQRTIKTKEKPSLIRPIPTNITRSDSYSSSF